MARPTKLNDETAAKIISAIRAGNYMETAAAHAGINKTTLYAWLNRGAKEQERVSAKQGLKVRKSELPYVEFSNAVQKALADAEVRDVAIIGNAASHDWKASAWRLERKFPDKWGRKKMGHDPEEEMLRLEKLRLDIEKTKAELLRLLEGESPDDYEDDGFMDALGHEAEEVWDDEDND